MGAPKKKEAGFLHGPCGKIWPVNEAKCPTCYPTKKKAVKA